MIFVRVGHGLSAISILLTEARLLYERSETLSQAAATARKGGFSGGAAWMGLAQAVIRDTGVTSAPLDRRWQLWGVGKYLLCLLIAGIGMALARPLGLWIVVPCGLLAFYLAEAQLVFLFPLLLDGHPQPLRASRGMTRRAGGTLAVMTKVIPIATFMLSGGWRFRGWVRAWLIGCLAVVLWYEHLNERGLAK